MLPASRLDVERRENRRFVPALSAGCRFYFGHEASTINCINVLQSKYRNNNATRAWFCVEARTFLSIAKRVKNASTSAAPISCRMSDIIKKDKPANPLNIKFSRFDSCSFWFAKERELCQVALP